MKKVLAMLLVVIALFSVMTIAVSAEEAPIASVPVPVADGTLNIYNNLTETLNTLGAWCEGVAAFLFRICIEPIILALSPILGFEWVPAA